MALPAMRRIRLASAYTVSSLPFATVILVFFMTAAILSVRSSLSEFLTSFSASTGPSPNCPCRDEASGRLYDFCYHLPMNTNVTGANFSCSHVANVKKLGLLDEKG
uniref:Uncharacterized protein n=1 Tax=Plectus sambesii TaxID=2011161 RepID=A0A914VEB1_9BILA